MFNLFCKDLYESFKDIGWYLPDKHEVNLDPKLIEVRFVPNNTMEPHTAMISGPGVNFRMVQMEQNCGALIVAGIDWAANPAALDFIARNIASCSGNNVLLASAHQARAKALVDLQTGWKRTVVANSARHNFHSKIAYLINHIPDAEMRHTGY